MQTINVAQVLAKYPAIAAIVPDAATGECRYEYHPGAFFPIIWDDRGYFRCPLDVSGDWE